MEWNLHLKDYWNQLIESDGRNDYSKILRSLHWINSSLEMWGTMDDVTCPSIMGIASSWSSLISTMIFALFIFVLQQKYIIGKIINIAVMMAISVIMLVQVIVLDLKFISSRFSKCLWWTYYKVKLLYSPQLIFLITLGSMTLFSM